MKIMRTLLSTAALLALVTVAAQAQATKTPPATTAGAKAAAAKTSPAKAPAVKTSAAKMDVATMKCTDGTASKGGQGACSGHGGLAVASGTCKDGTKSYINTKVGACSRHGGVKDWVVGKK